MTQDRRVPAAREIALPGTKPDFGDIDLAVQLEAKERDGKRHAELMVERGSDAQRHGRRFS
jgi:hypothetical protein